MHKLDLSSLRRSFVGVSGQFAVGIPLLFLANVVLARTLSVGDFGAFSFAISLATVLAIPLTGGLPMLLTREVAAYSQSHQWGSCKGVIRWAYQYVFKASFVLLLVVLFGLAAGWKYSLGGTFIAVCVVPILGLNGLRSGILKGLGRPALSEFPIQVMQPIVMIAGYLALFAIGLASASTALLWYLAACVIVFVFASIMQWRVQPLVLAKASADKSHVGEWRRSVLPLTLVSAATVVFAQLALILLGMIDEKDGVAIFRVAERGAMLVAMPMMLVNTILGPYFVNAHRSADIASLSRIARHSARLTSGISLLGAFVLLIFGRQLLEFAFGSPYGELSYVPLTILVCAQLGSVLLGSAGYMLAVTGHEKLALLSSVVGIIALFSVGIIAIPTLGVLGASLAAAMGIIASKVVAFWCCWRIHRISTGII